MSHDPSHWRAQILDYNIPLTLSGHTHAMQLGIEIGNINGVRHNISTRNMTDYMKTIIGICMFHADRDTLASPAE